MKKGNLRRDQILDCAQELIAQKGVSQTSTNDIVKELGIARGTFYHHFSSKEDMVDGLVDRLNQELFENAWACAKDSSIGPLERIFVTLSALQIKNQLGRRILDHLHSSENALLHQKIQDSMVQEIPPIFAYIVEEGIREGIFQSKYPLEAMELFVVYAITYFDDKAEVSSQNKTRRILAFIDHLALILSLSPQNKDRIKTILMERENV